MNPRIIWTASNVLSLARIVLLIPIIYLLHRGLHESLYNLYALGVMVVAALTDTFDGLLARRLDQITDFGKIIDPMADKVAFIVILGYLTVTRPDFPAWFFIIAVVRDLIIFTAGWWVKARHGVLFVSNMLGKTFVTVVALMVFVFVIKDNYGLTRIFQLLLAVSTALMIASSLSYAVKFRRFLKSHAV
jgi:CDP-diacylglycerol--glycerol-3-phosphate 3-phosphatidyltransferase